MKDSSFRGEVQAFLRESLTPEIKRAGELMTSVFSDFDAGLAWHKILYKKGCENLNIFQTTRWKLRLCRKWLLEMHLKLGLARKHFGQSSSTLVFTIFSAVCS